MHKTVACLVRRLTHSCVRAFSAFLHLSPNWKVGGVATGLVAAYALGMFSSKGPDTAENRHIQGNGKQYKFFNDVSGATPSHVASSLASRRVRAPCSPA